jgi:hypothetical protein
LRAPLASELAAVVNPTPTAQKPLPDALESQERKRAALEAPPAASPLVLGKDSWRSVSPQQVARMVLRNWAYLPYKRRDSPCDGFAAQYTLPWGTN